MRFILSTSLLITLVTSPLLAHYPKPITTDRMMKEMTLIPNLGSLHHPVTTNNLEAQKYFDQGLTLVYAFNHDAAFRSFEKAAKLDPNLAMAYWGMAYSLGTNINLPINAENEIRAYNIIQRAIQLMPNASPNEQSYIKALSRRYSNDPNFNAKELEKNYNTAMREVVKEYPDDLDAATLYAESIMNLNPWKLWTLNGDPEPGTLEAVAALESVLKRNPDHIGANHYYIHAIEASRYPERALMSAKRLPGLVPNSGHLQHMPSHIYMLVGDYILAANANEAAVTADKEYIKQFGLTGIYPVHYLSHNLSFLSRSYAMAGNFQGAMNAAQELSQLYDPHYKEMPDLEYYHSVPIFVLMRFQKWNEILNVPPPQDPKEMHVSMAIWLYARAYAYAALGNLQKAQQEKNKFHEELKKVQDEDQFGSNQAKKILAIADATLDAKIAEQQGDLEGAIKYFKEAVHLQDSLDYSEPPDWYYPIRESLGMALINAKKYTEAENIFREDLIKNPKNGRDLFGLLLALKAQGKDNSAYWIEQEYNRAWQYSDGQK